MIRPDAAPRLRRELLIRLMLPLLTLVAASGLTSTYVMQRLTDRVYDQWLLDTANSLAAEVHFDGAHAQIEMPSAAHAMLAYDDIDKVSFAATQGDELLAGGARLPLDGKRMLFYDHGRAYDAELLGQSVRIAALTVGGSGAVQPVEIRVAETLRKRERMRADVLILLFPLGALLLVSAATIGYIVRRTLKPLEELAGRWSAHSHQSLTLIDTQGVPRELIPFASALNELLLRLNAMLERERQFSANVAHQLRTPLAGLMLGLSRAEDSDNLAGARAAIAELKSTTRRLNRLVQQLLALGRIGPDGSHTMEFAPTDLVALAQDIGSSFAEQSARRDIALELDVPAAPLVVRVHPDLVSEALSNLLDNAIRYTPRGGRITVSFDADPPSIIVADSGSGINEAEREHVFGRFIRGGTASDQGSGLGLAIVREIMRLHGGEVLLLQAAPAGGLKAVLQFARPE